MMYLKQSTSVDVPIGPFLDETDGKTAETALTITQPDVRLKKNNGNWAQKNAAQTLTHEENGWYEVTLDATDTDTIGHLVVAVHESGALPVWREFHVLAANVYDSLFGAATDKLDVNVEEWNTTAVPAEHTAGYPVVTVKDGTGTGEINTNAGKVVGVELVDTLTTYTGNTVQTGDSFARLGAPAGASVSADIAAIEAQTDDIGAAGAGLTAVPWNAAWDAEVQSEVADALDAAVPGSPTANSINERIKTLDDADLPGRLPAALVSGRMDSSVGAMAANTLTASALAADAVTEIQAGLSTLDAAGVRSAVGLASANLDTQLSALAVFIDTEVAAILAAVDTEVAAIKAKTDQLTFTTANRVDCQVFGMEAGTVTAAAVATGAIDADALAADVINDIWAGTALTEAYRGTGAAGTPAQLLYEILQNITEFAISGTTKTVKKLDGSTTAKTYTLDSSTTPTSITEAT